MKKLDPKTTPGFLVTRVSHVLSIQVRRSLDEVGVQNSVEEMSILTVLGNLSGPERMKSLAKLVGRDATTVSRQIDGLEESGLVKRSPCPNDGRATVVSVTAAGAKLVDRTSSMTLKLREKALSGISSSDRRVLTKALLRMLQNLQDEEPSVGKPLETT